MYGPNRLFLLSFFSLAAGMHKKSMETTTKLKEGEESETQVSAKQQQQRSISPEPKVGGEKLTTPSSTPMLQETKNEADKLRSDSIASLRAKALEHSVKLGMVSSAEEREDVHDKMNSNNRKEESPSVSPRRMEEMLSNHGESNSPEADNIDVESNDVDHRDQRVADYR